MSNATVALSQTLDRGLACLDFVAASERAVSVEATAAALGLHRSIVYRLLRTLERRRLIERDAELVFARTGGDVIVGVRINIGIHTQRDRRAQIFFAGDSINAIEFRFALDVETQDALVERILNFLM